MPVDILKQFPDRVLWEDARMGDSGVSVRSLGVTTLLFDDGETQLLFDGHVTRPPLLRTFLGRIEPDRELVRSLIGKYGMDRLAGIFASHTHYDHVLDVPCFSELTDAHVYGSASTLNVARGNGIDENRLHLFRQGEEYPIGGFRVRILPSRHSKPGFYNDDIGREIKAPVTFPARKRELPEGGSFDFLVSRGDRRFLIRPSCNYIPGALEGCDADVFFYGIAQMDKLSDRERAVCYRETICRVRPRLVIPIHWDDFFLPLERASMGMAVFDRPARAMRDMIDRLGEDRIDFRILPAGVRVWF